MKRKWVIAAWGGITVPIACLVVLLGLWFSPFWRGTSRDYIEHWLVKPLPEGISEYRDLYFFDPTFGDGVLIVEFNATPEALKAILNATKWERLAGPLSNTTADLIKERGPCAIYHAQLSDLVSADLLIAETGGKTVLCIDGI